jgi:hypothetical protein
MTKAMARVRLLLIATLALGAFAAAPNIAQAQFGMTSFGVALSTSQAGAHADVSTSFALNTEALGNPVGQLRDASITLPPGVIGNPQAIERCSIKSLQEFACARDSQVGVLSASGLSCQGVSSPLQAPAEAGATTLAVPNAEAFCAEQESNTVTIGTGASTEQARIANIVNATTLELTAPLQHQHAAGEPVIHVAKVTTGSIPLFNLQPSAGHVATFGASLIFTDLFVQVSVGPAGRLTATLSETSTLLPLQAATLTLWGVPAAPTHNSLRCNELLQYECGPSTAEPVPFMTNPSACSAALEAEISVTSWQGQSDASTATLPALTGCESLTIAPGLTVVPSTTQRDTPAGYEVDLNVPQAEQPYGLATPDPQNVRVTLPAGTSLSPAMANGLQSCTDAQFAQGNCPGTAKLGTAEIVSPLLPEHLTGGVYLGTPTATEKYRVLVRVSAQGTAIALEGQAQTNEVTGQVTAVFENLPQLPFTELRLIFSAGPQAAFVNPPACGIATSTSEITSYAGQSANLSSSFTVDENGEAGTCPSSPPFAPGFSAGTTSPLAGSFSPFTLTVSRADGEQSLSMFAAQLPVGLEGLLSSVPFCPEPQAGEGTCTEASEVGSATIGAGAGPQQLYVSGPVYLTGPYDGAPFGLAVVLNVAAGPLNLGTVLVRSRILVNPTSLALSIVSDPLPQILSGIPLRVRTLELTLDRPRFIFNPTSCSAQTVAAAITSYQGASIAAATPFAVAGCHGLPFAPKLTASTRARAAADGDGAALNVTVSANGGPPPSTSAVAEANMRSIKVQLPGQLQSRLATLRQACRAGTFLVNPSSCPAGAVIGTGTLRTPVLNTPLTGAIYLVSHGSNAFPSLALVLHSEDIAFTLEGTISISKSGVTSSEFSALPDVPVTLFSLNLPAGPHSVFGAIAKLCGARLSMPATIEAQNGKRFTQRTNVLVSGCPTHRSKARRRGTA